MQFRAPLKGIREWGDLGGGHQSDGLPLSFCALAHPLLSKKANLSEGHLCARKKRAKQNESLSLFCYSARCSSSRSLGRMSELSSLSVTADDARHHSLTSLASAAIAQLGERQTEDLKVPGSIPGLGMPAGAYAV